MVARAIFHRPAVLFLDEPTAGLDPQSRLALWEILGELNRDGQTILLTTHYMEEADHLCGRVAIMDHGKILALDTPEALKQTIGADTIVTVKAAGDGQALAERLAGEIPEVTRTRGPRVAGVELHVKDAQWLVPRVVNAAESGGFQLADLSVSEPSLETVFTVAAPTGKDLRDRWPPALTPAATSPGATSAPTTIEPADALDAAEARLLGALLAPILRDLVVLWKNKWEFVTRTLVQPFLLVFVFLYVFPTIGQGVGGHGPVGESAFATVLVLRARRRHHDHVPGHPGGGDGARPGVRVHA